MTSRAPISTRFIRIFGPLALLVMLLLIIGYRAAVTARLDDLERAEEVSVALLGESLADDFQAVRTDLLVLARDESLQQTLVQPSSQRLALLGERFRRFAETKRVYDQIRILDLQGQEMVRVNYAQGAVQVVPAEFLQAKQDRYYVRETLAQADGDIFVSPFDLNVEDGKIELPYKPTIRFGTPVVDAAGVRRGILVLNYLGQRMLTRFARLDAESPGQAMLLNDQGYWLYAGNPDREWGFMFADRQADSFAAQFVSAWGHVSRETRGQWTTTDGLITFETVQPFRTPTLVDDTPVASDRTSRVDDRTWKVVSHVSRAQLTRHLDPIRRGVVALTLLLGTGALGGSWALMRLALARERSEQALRESESRFRQMAAAIAEVFWMSSVDRQELLYVSPAFASIWGEPLESARQAGEHWRASIVSDDMPLAQPAWQLTANVEQFAAEYRIRRADGAIRWISDHGFAVHDPQGEIVRYAGIAADITPIKEAQGRLLQSERLAAIGEAITGLAHESRNALQRSQACLEMLTRRVADRPEAADLVQRTQQALRDLHRLYETVREYAAPLQLQRVVCDVCQVWRDACADLQATIDHRHAVVREEPESRDTRCAIDPDAIRQVFRNVLENGLAEDLDARATRDHVEIVAQWRDGLGEHKNLLQFVIRDNGPGFTQGTPEQIFEPFFTTRTRGTGLGMAISRRIIEAHGGRITAQVGPIKGLEIHILLPKVIS